MEIAMVLPEYRGNNLQSFFIRERLEMARKKGMKHVASTVSVENIHSLVNLKDEGFSIKKTTEKYGGRMRHLLLKNL